MQLLEQFYTIALFSILSSRQSDYAWLYYLTRRQIGRVAQVAQKRHNSSAGKTWARIALLLSSASLFGWLLIFIAKED